VIPANSHFTDYVFTYTTDGLPFKAGVDTSFDGVLAPEPATWAVLLTGLCLAWNPTPAQMTTIESDEAAAGGGTMHRLSVAFIFAAAIGFAGATASAQQQTPRPKGVVSFGVDQTIADIGMLEWAPLSLQGLPPGAEIAILRGDLAKGGGEILLRTPPKYVVPNHSHTSDEVYVWLKGQFTYVAADGTRQRISAPAYISLPGQTPHALECGDEPCIFYLHYSRPFDLQVHAMPAQRQ